MPTIYTFGDPDIVIEALLALATIFNSSAWSDGGSAFGLGGNFAVAALIGLLAILLAGLNEQTIRLDYLLTAFLLFAIVFSIDTDVNVEDVETGQARIVADVPIGVAYVAAISSNIAWSITETADTALQRPGSPTTALNEGFLNPLKALLAIRPIALKDLSGTLHRSMLEYYKNCIGKTIENTPALFDMDVFLTDANPVAYMFDTTNIGNYLTVYYTDAAPAGINQSCHATAPSLATDLGDIAAGATDEVEGWIRRQLATSSFDTNWSLVDINNAVDVTYRATVAGQDFIAAQLVRNLHNAGEAWRTAEYGSDKAQYVTTMTNAFEQQRVSDATKGSAFLQTMIPLMSFFQFLFFLLAPFVAFIAICVPQASLKTVGLYLLLGVWAYSWMPIATVINHYMQIQVQNTLEYADTAGVGTGFTSILGFDSTYNILATKLAIGSQALAWTPTISAALLTLSVFGIAKAAASAGQVRPNASIASPDVAKNGPVLNRAALATASSGERVSPGGVFAAASRQQQDAFPEISVGRKISDVTSATTAKINAATREQNQVGRRFTQTIQGIGSSTSIERDQRQAIREAVVNTTGQRIQEIANQSTGKSLTASDVSQIQTHMGLRAMGTGSGLDRSTIAGLSDTAQSVISHLEQEEQQLQAQSILAMENNGSIEDETMSSLRRDASRINELSESIKAAESLQSEARRAQTELAEVGGTQSFSPAELSELAMARPGGAHAVSKTDNILRRIGGEAFADDFRQRMQATSRDVAATDIHGTVDPNAPINQQSAYLYELQKASGQDPRALEALFTVMDEVSGVKVPLSSESIDKISELGVTSPDSRASVLSAMGASGVASAGQGLANGNITGEEAEIAGLQDRVTSASSGLGSIDEFRDGAKAIASDGRALDRSGAERARSMINQVMQGARDEMDESVTAHLHNYLQGDAGFNEAHLQTLDTMQSGFGSSYAETAQRVEQGATAVARLEGAMAGQLGARGIKPTEMYQQLLDQGFTPKMAAQATYSAVGYQKPGAADKLAFAAFGTGVISGTAKALETRMMNAAGSDKAAREAVAKSKGARFLRAVKIGGPLATAAGFVGIYAYGDHIAERNAEQANRRIIDDVLTTLNDQGEYEGFISHLRQNELSGSDGSGVYSMSAAQLINEYARYNNQDLPFGELAGQRDPLPSVEINNIGAIQEDLAGRIRGD